MAKRRFPDRHTPKDYLSDLRQFMAACPKPWREIDLHAHRARTTLESIAYQIWDVFDTMQLEASAPLQVLLADGGPTRNQALIQFQADILGVPVMCSLVSYVSALGAAYLAGLTIGLSSSETEIAALPRPQVRYEPVMDENEKSRLCAGWKEAMGRVLYSNQPYNQRRLPSR